MCEMIKKYEDEAKGLCDVIGHYIGEWFKNLLDIAENGWDTEKAENMENEIMNCNEVLYNFNKLDIAATSTHKYLNELGLI